MAFPWSMAHVLILSLAFGVIVVGFYVTFINGAGDDEE